MAPAVFPPVRIVNELEPRAMWESPNGSYVFDLGQNFAGGVRLSLPGPTTAGTKIIVRHAEAVMHPPYGAQVSKRPLSSMPRISGDFRHAPLFHAALSSDDPCSLQTTCALVLRGNNTFMLSLYTLL